MRMDKTGTRKEKDSGYDTGGHVSTRTGQETMYEKQGLITWRSPSNIALIKYWGKRKVQIPENPSVSITLSKSFSETTLRYVASPAGKGKLVSFKFAGTEKQSFKERIATWLKELRRIYPFLEDFDLQIESRNSFPHSSGIASSASAMSSMALCLTSMERSLYGSPSDDELFYRKASYIARLGSGSAARSVYPGFVLWGRAPAIPQSSDEFAVPLNDLVHPVFNDMRNAILIVDDNPKLISSSYGHALMDDNPWSSVRYEQAQEHVIKMIRVLASGDLEKFVRIVEDEAIILHSLMRNSDPDFILAKPATRKIIKKVRIFRRDTGLPLAFTLDAGPNVHLIYPGEYEGEIKSFIRKELLGHCTEGRWIDDATGTGPVRIMQKED
jgi:diphosphomevalonate decarboxylase